MRPGYLSVHTHSAHQGRIRLVVTDREPPRDAGQPEPHVRYTARFNDVDAALMHAHEALKRRLIDPDAHLYRADLARAIAAVKAVELRHEMTYTDPCIDDATHAAIERFVERQHVLQRRKDQFFRALGAIGIAILLFNLFVLSLA